VKGQRTIEALLRDQAKWVRSEWRPSGMEMPALRPEMVRHVACGANRQTAQLPYVLPGEMAKRD
jgi:hypothetical protein